MATLPAKSIVKASARWLQLLRTSTVDQAAATVRANAAYVDLTMTQYSSGLELLKSLNLLDENASGALVLSPVVSCLAVEHIGQVLLERLLEVSLPAWLRDADVLIRDVDEIPDDAMETAEALNLGGEVTYSVIRTVHGHIDLEQRNSVGLAGEEALLQMLEQSWPGSTTHVAKISDGFGYDILFHHEGQEWRLEVKSTTRRGRLVMFLSRNEYEVSLRDPRWRLVIVGLDPSMQLKAVATVKEDVFLRRSPADTSKESRWQSASHELSAADLHRGLSFVGTSNSWDDPADRTIPGLTSQLPNQFSWMPPRS